MVCGQRIGRFCLNDDPKGLIRLVPSVTQNVDRDGFRRFARQERDWDVEQARIISIVVEAFIHRRADINSLSRQPRPVAGYREGQSGIAFGD